MEERDVFDLAPERLQRQFQDFQGLYAAELENYLVGRATGPAVTWQRDYGSLEAYLQSVEGHRRRWHDVLGRFDADAVSDRPVESRLFHEEDAYRADWIEFEFLPGVMSRAVVATPRNTAQPPPVVVLQHGIDSSPFQLFGLNDERGLYAAAGHRLARAGFAVVAPVNKSGRPARHRLECVAHVCGVSLFGLECYKLQRLIDALQTLPGLHVKRLAFAGLSLGGLMALFLTPIEMRIRAAVSAAWFNHRRRKLVVGDPKYSCFLEVDEPHIFLPGWLPEFSDSDLVSLICPRPLMIQTGKGDMIAWWPLVQEEFAAARQHYDRLGLGERIEWLLHDGGHEFVYAPLEAFLRRWLVEDFE